MLSKLNHYRKDAPSTNGATFIFKWIWTVFPPLYMTAVLLYKYPTSPSFHHFYTVSLFSRRLSGDFHSPAAIHRFPATFRRSSSSKFTPPLLRYILLTYLQDFANYLVRSSIMSFHILLCSSIYIYMYICILVCFAFDLKSQLAIECILFVE